MPLGIAYVDVECGLFGHDDMLRAPQDSSSFSSKINKSPGVWGMTDKPTSPL